MANLNAVIRERKQILNAFKAKARQVQDAADWMIRYLTRTVARKRNVPTIDDYETIVKGLQAINTQIDDFEKQIASARTIFT